MSEKNLLQKLIAGNKNYCDVKFPGSDDTIRIRLLTAQDVFDASVAADKIFKNAGVDVTLQNINVYENEKYTQLLFRACSTVDGDPLAANISEFRETLTIAARDFLSAEYDKLDAECNIALDNMSDDEFDTLLESVKKNPNTLSTVSSIKTLKRLVEFLIRQSTK